MRFMQYFHKYSQLLLIGCHYSRFINNFITVFITSRSQIPSQGGYATVSIIESIITAAPYLKEFLGPEYALAVADRENYLWFEDSQVLKLGLQAGTPLKPGSVAETTIRTGSRQVVQVPASVYGVPYIGIGVPIKENGEVVGALASAYPIALQENIKNIASALRDSAAGANLEATNLSSSAQELAASAAELASSSDLIRAEVESVSEVLVLIKDIAAMTHLLGLNAAIEAARAGEHGRGFTVVAEEIRKLADKTQRNVKEISSKLENVRQQVIAFVNQVQQISAVAEHQAASTQHIAALLQQLDDTATNLNTVAEKLIK